MAIKKCRACNSKKLTNVISLGDHYLSDFLPGDKVPPSFPLELVLCNECNLLQLEETTPPSLLYTDRYGYKSGINSTMKEELKTIVENALSRISEKNKKIVVLDIGANDGTLLKNYPKKYFKIAVEPIKKIAQECKKSADIVVNDYFSYEAYSKKVRSKASIITAISCFYDIENPNKFLSDVKKILHENGIFIIQQNYLVEMLKKNAFDNIVHEHLEYYSLSSLEKLLDKHELEVVDVEITPINGGSFRTYIKHMGSVRKMKLMEQKDKLNQIKTYREFSTRIRKIKNQLHNFISKEVKKGKTVYVYGASTRGNTLLQYCDLDNSLIKAAVERNPDKWGKKIASVGIPIISEEQARKEKPDYMLVLPWFFKDEFLKREKKYLDQGGHLIFPLPKFEII